MFLERCEARGTVAVSLLWADLTTSYSAVTVKSCLPSQRCFRWNCACGRQVCCCTLFVSVFVSCVRDKFATAVTRLLAPRVARAGLFFNTFIHNISYNRMVRGPQRIHICINCPEHRYFCSYVLLHRGFVSWVVPMCYVQDCNTSA